MSVSGPVSDDVEGNAGQYVTNLTTANEVVDFNPDILFELGVAETIEWYRDHPIFLEQI